MKVKPSFALGTLAVVVLLGFGFGRIVLGDDEDGDEHGDSDGRRAHDGERRSTKVDRVEKRSVSNTFGRAGGAGQLTLLEDRSGRIDNLPPNPVAGEMDAEAAAQAFSEAMAALDGALEQERMLSSSEKGDLYNQASGALTVLSRHTNMTDPTERLLLEEAYREMKGRMAALELRPAEELPLPQEYGMAPPAPPAPPRR
jgi:hypothetical protein